MQNNFMDRFFAEPVEGEWSGGVQPVMRLVPGEMRNTIQDRSVVMKVS